MPITYDPQHRLFKLDTNLSTYAFMVYEENYLVHLYYGAKIPDTDLSYLMYRSWFSSQNPYNPNIEDPRFSPDITPMEYADQRRRGLPHRGPLRPQQQRGLRHRRALCLPQNLRRQAQPARPARHLRPGGQGPDAGSGDFGRRHRPEGHLAVTPSLKTTPFWPRACAWRTPAARPSPWSGRSAPAWSCPPWIWTWSTSTASGTRRTPPCATPCSTACRASSPSGA